MNTVIHGAQTGMPIGLTKSSFILHYYLYLPWN